MRGINCITRVGRRIMRAEWPIVLMYHRVATLTCDPWQKAVTPSKFERQLAILMRERTVVPLAWLVREWHEGRKPKRLAAITFDDGYADVLYNGKPILE